MTIGRGKGVQKRKREKKEGQETIMPLTQFHLFLCKAALITLAMAQTFSSSYFLATICTPTGAP